jgi:hypothetical protein
VLPIQLREFAMQPTELVTLNMRELDRLKVIQAVVDRMLKPGRAAERLQLTTRQIERVVLRYRQSGAAGIVSQARGRPGNRKLDEGVACEQQLGQGPRGTREPDAAGPVGEGTEAARHRHPTGGECLCAPLYR